MHKDLIVIGASAGGLQAIRHLVSLLPATLSACVLVVLHISSKSRGSLPAVFARCAGLPVFGAEHGAPIRPGRIYVAPPDHHLLVGPSSIVLDSGPRVNRARPAIDPLFCSAAALFGPRVIGVVLTGLLGDGSAGLLAIKRAGGVAIVQDPQDAEFSDMPETALSRVSVDYCAPLREIPELLRQLVVCPTGLVSRPTSDLDKVTVRHSQEVSSARASAPGQD
jgi:two-component system chemotaxis response regulator CheB